MFQPIVVEARPCRFICGDEGTGDAGVPEGPTARSEVEALPVLTTLEKVVEAEKTFLPEKVLLSMRSVEDAVEIVSAVSPRVRVTPLTTIVECARSVLATVAQIAAPAPLMERMNWLVQPEPVYEVTPDVPFPTKSVEESVVEPVPPLPTPRVPVR